MNKKIYLLTFIIMIFTSLPLPSQQQQQETITITTFYPSPVGVYNRLVTRTLGIGDNNNDGQITDADSPEPATNAGDLWVARNVQIGNNLRVVNNVGIRTNLNQPLLVPLEVAGEVKIGNTGLPCTSGTQGTLRYNNGQIEFCNGQVWRNALELSNLCYCIQLACDGLPQPPGIVRCAPFGTATAWAGSGYSSGGQNCAGGGLGEVARIIISTCTHLEELGLL